MSQPFRRTNVLSWLLLGVWSLQLAVTAAPNKPFPRHWGAPPQIQTMDHIPLPGGYGMGSSTLASWIRRNLARDERSPDVVQKQKPFPVHWGAPPRMQTRDLRPLPGDYGRGSSTLARWIQANLDRDAASAPPPSPILYRSDFSGGKIGSDLFVLDGDFGIRETPDGKVLELAATPLKNFGVLFGPTGSTKVLIHARIRGAANGRRQPAFGIGLGGVSGYQLRVVGAKQQLEITHRGERVAQAEFSHAAGLWTHLKFQCRPGENGWQLEGRAWTEGSPEPATWQLAHRLSEPPPPGRASAWGEPFAALPIQFDTLQVSSLAP